jgi:hypothetical protein
MMDAGGLLPQFCFCFFFFSFFFFFFFFFFFSLSTLSFIWLISNSLHEILAEDLS